jgi:hypothetical protein
LKRHLDELTAEKEMQSQLLENLLQRQLKKAGSSSFDGEEDETSRSSVGEEEKLCLPRKRLKLRHKRLFEKEKNVFELPKLSSPKMTKAEITPGRFERPDERREVSLPVLENAQISEQIQQLKGEKDALKQERLDLRQLPHGSEEFSSLQLERLLGRSKINRSIETVGFFSIKNIKKLFRNKYFLK